MPIVEEGCLPSAVRFLLRGSLVAQEYSAGLILNLATNRQSTSSATRSKVWSVEDTGQEG